MLKPNFIFFLIIYCALYQNVSAQGCLSPAPPHNYFVTDSLDYTAGSLRQQILNANADGTGGQIYCSFALNTLYLQSPLPMITVDSLAIFDVFGLPTLDGGNVVSDPVFTFSQNAPHSCYATSIRCRNFLPTTFYVTSVNDSGPGTLREAISKSNSTDSQDNINFNIPGIAPHRIDVLSQIYLTHGITIDGTTQPANGYTGSSPKIELDGGGSGVAFWFNNYMQYDSMRFNIYGLYIHHFAQAIYNGIPCSSVNIGSMTKRNVISGNTSNGLQLFGDNINIVGNYIGTDTSGNFGEPNFNGIYVGGGRNVSILNNVISGNQNWAIEIPSTSSNYIIKGNKIGVGKNGTDSIPNGAGIACAADTVQIGGLQAADKNIIAYNGNSGIYVWTQKVSILGNSIYSNYWAGIETILAANDSILRPVITKMNYDTIAGTSRPYARIELFYNVDLYYRAQGKTFIASVNADSSGNWKYISHTTNPCDVTATQTDSGNTSAFSNISNYKVHLMNDTVVCSGQSLDLNAGFGFSSYQWNTGDTTRYITVNTSGDYIVQTISQDVPCYSSDTIHVRFGSPFSFGSDTLFCSGQPVIYTVPGYASYLWNDSTTNNFITIDSSGTYSLTVTDSNSCTYSDTSNISFHPPISIFLGNDTTLCSSQSIMLDAGSGFSDYQWQDGSSAQNFSVTDTVGGGTILIHALVTDINGCIATDTIRITFDLPVAFGSDTLFCSNQPVILNAGNFISYLWNDSSTNNSIVIDSSGIFAVTITDSNLCTASDTINVSFHSIPLVYIGPDIAICSMQSIILDAGSGFTNYLWQDGSTSQTFSAVDSLGGSTISYSVLVTDSNGCSATDTINIFSHPAPSVSIGADTTICNSQSIILDAGSGFVNYHWQDGSTSQTFTAIDTLAGDTVLYFVQVTDNNGCNATDSIQIIFVICTQANNMDVYSDFMVYPNPSQNFIMIYIKNISMLNNLRFDLYDLTGRKVLSEILQSPVQKIDLNNLSKNIYLYKLFFNNETSGSGKLIVE